MCLEIELPSFCSLSRVLDPLHLIIDAVADAPANGMSAENCDTTTTASKHHQNMKRVSKTSNRILVQPVPFGAGLVPMGSSRHGAFPTNLCPSRHSMIFTLLSVLLLLRSIVSSPDFLPTLLENQAISKIYMYIYLKPPTASR